MQLFKINDIPRLVINETCFSVTHRENMRAKEEICNSAQGNM